MPTRRGRLKNKLTILLLLLSALAMLSYSCDKDPVSPDPAIVECSIANGLIPDFVHSIACETDFVKLASEPVDKSIPGATTVKTLIDTANADSLYFIHSKNFPLHWDFAFFVLSGNGKPIVPDEYQFASIEYLKPDRRFLLGAVTRYDGPGVWAYEIAPYDNASVEMIVAGYQRIAESCFFGDDLYFHPTSQAVGETAQKLPSSVKVITSDELHKGTDYQALNLGKSMGRLVFMSAEELETDYVGYRDIVVLDTIPNDISVVSGIISDEFQTPLSHINVLSQNRGTPNMALRGAFANDTLLALEGKWVELTVGILEYSISEVSKEVADAWWEEHMPVEISIPPGDLETKELRDIEDILSPAGYGLAVSMTLAIPAYGGKASHFAAFPHMNNEKVPYPKAFAVPIYYYWQFMEQNGFLTELSQMLADKQFQDDPSVRDERLEKLRNDMINAPIDPDFEAALLDKLNSDYPGIRMRFRSSTNAEDLNGFTGAGLYTSKSGDPDDPASVRDAVRKVWASVWNFRAFEERSYRNIDHLSVGMALLVHHSFPDEEANGVAITANPFDPGGRDPGLYINVQLGEESVVQPEPGNTTDQFIYHYFLPGQPIIFIAHSNLVPQGTTVLTDSQVHSLGVALNEIHNFFYPLYGGSSWYAMDIEFKFDQALDDPMGEPVLVIKQARPYPAWGLE